MNPFKKLYSAAENYIFRNADERRLMVEAVQRGSRNNDSSLYNRLVKEGINLKAKTIKDLKQAVAAASDPELPYWQPLADLYRNLMLDNHLASVIDSRILYVQRSPFKIVNDKDEENTELSWLLERPWHDDLIYKVLFSKYQGRTLIEMYNLTSEGELADIEEIPQEHFNSMLGIITAEPDGSSGWNYREPPFDMNYLQIGKDNDMGMLERLAPIVLAKKLAIGSYQDYIDKFGIPPIFITTDREDDNRLQQLFEAAQNFKKNQFMVGRGQEKFEVGNISGNGVAPFDALITRVNDEISKRVLGGSGLTDEKSFVGSAEIQYRLAKDRFESDKLYYKYIFNEHIKPRLIALSPVYKPLADHYFEWDNTESLNVKEIIEAMNTLSGSFDIDPEYVERITGIPVTKKEPPAPLMPPMAPTSPESPEPPTSPKSPKSTDKEKDDTPPSGGKDEKKK